MTKYYKVWLNKNLTGTVFNPDQEHVIICKINFFTTNFFKELVFEEIITGKIIYPSTLKLTNGLTYELKETYHLREPHCEKINATEVQEWLKKLDEKSLKEYIDGINKLEAKAIKCYEENKQQKIEEKKIQKNATKNIKRTLRKMKAR